jgi:hypothetical protein
VAGWLRLLLAAAVLLCCCAAVHGYEYWALGGGGGSRESGPGRVPSSGSYRPRSTAHSARSITVISMGSVLLPADRSSKPTRACGLDRALC